jgi:hypothetical protein
MPDGAGRGADRVLGLEVGADDYVTNSLLPRELVLGDPVGAAPASGSVFARTTWAGDSYATATWLPTRGPRRALKISASASIR